jgi:outer membrane protein assembly factor BamB
LRGIGDDGGTTVVTLDDARGTESSVVMVVGRDGSVKHRYELKSPVGVPGAAAGLAFVPWDSQYVSGVDLNTGDEVGRILLRHQVSQVRNIGGELYFGQLGFTRFDEKIGAAQRRAANYVELPSRVLPGKPTWYHDGTLVRVPSDSATTKIRLLARPVMKGNEPEVAGGIYVTTYFSLAIGLNAEDASLAWVRGLPNDIVGGGAAANGFVFCDEGGKLWSTGSTGAAPTQASDLGSKISACSVQVNQVTAANDPPEPLAQQVSKVFERTLPQLASGYAFIVEEVPKIEDPLVTKILIELIENPRTVPSIAKRARTLLSGQRIGEDHMLAALERHYDFLSGNRPPPVGPLADALAALEERRAAPLLAKQLNDPANEAGDIQKVAQALHELAGPGELPELKTFFALYRATASEANMENAVILVAEAIIRVGGDEGRALVRQAAFDPLTAPSVRSGLNKALQPPPGPSKVSRNPAATQAE